MSERVKLTHWAWREGYSASRDYAGPNPYQNNMGSEAWEQWRAGRLAAIELWQEMLDTQRAMLG